MIEMQTLEDRLHGLEALVELVLPRLMASSPARTVLEAHLQTLAARQTTPELDQDEHHLAQLAETLLASMEDLPAA